MKITNLASFGVRAFGFHTEHGYGDDTYIKSGETADIYGPYVGEMDGGTCRLVIEGEIICHEPADTDTAFRIGRGEPVHLQNGAVGVRMRHEFDDPEPHVEAWWNREAVLLVSEDGKPPCENPENLVCHECGEEKHVRNFIPRTTCCISCHELSMMHETGHGVVTYEGPGLLGLNGDIFRIR